MRINKLKNGRNTKNVKNLVLMLSMLGMFSNANYSLAMKEDYDDSFENYDVNQIEDRENDDDYDNETIDEMKNNVLEDSNDMEDYAEDEDEKGNNEKFKGYQNYKKELRKPTSGARKTLKLPDKTLKITLDDFMNEIRNYSKGMFSDGKLLNWLVQNKKVKLNKQNKNIDISYFTEPRTYFKLLEKNKKINVAIGVDENKYIHFYAYSIRPVHVKSALSKLIIHESVLKKYLSLLSSVCKDKNDVQELLLDLILTAADRLPEVRMSPDSKSWDTELCIELLKAVCPNSYTNREIKMLRSANYELPIETSLEKNEKKLKNVIEDIQRTSKLPRIKKLIPDDVNKKNKLKKNKPIKLNFSDKNYLDKKTPLNIKQKPLADKKKNKRKLDDEFQSRMNEKNIEEKKYKNPKFGIEQLNDDEDNIYEIPEEKVDYEDLADDVENENVADEDVDSNDEEDYTE